MYIDLPLVWACIIAFGVFVYVVLDGFDLGIGILFSFAPSHADRDKLMNSVAPVWDGNETWLILGGAALLGAFPIAYAVLLSAFYLPLIVMLIALIFRGVAFEFRFKARTSRYVWDRAFALARRSRPSPRAWSWARSFRACRWRGATLSAAPSSGSRRSAF